jgi:hypothetical protein
MKHLRLALTAMVIGTVACSSIQTVKDPAAYMATNPEMVVVVFNDGSELPIAQPQLRGDTLFGTWQGLGEPVSAPLNQLQRIDAIQKDPKKTVLMVGGLTAGAAVFAYGFSRAWGNSSTVCSWDRGVDDRGDPSDLGEERCFAIR